MISAHACRCALPIHPCVELNLGPIVIRAAPEMPSFTRLSSRLISVLWRNFFAAQPAISERQKKSTKHKSTRTASAPEVEFLDSLGVTTRELVQRELVSGDGSPALDAVAGNVPRSRGRRFGMAGRMDLIQHRDHQH